MGAKNSRLRIEGTRNLMAAAQGRGVAPRGGAEHRLHLRAGAEAAPRGDPLDESEAQRTSLAGVVGLEEAVLNTPGIDGIVLRYGRLYGPGTWFDKPGGAGAAARAMPRRMRRCSR